MSSLLSFPDYPLIFWPVAAVSLLILGLGKSGFGGGLGLLAVPLISLVIPPVDAAALLLPLLLIMDIFSIRHYRRTYDRHTLWILLPAATVGIVLGGFFFRQFSSDEELLRFGIGLIGLLFVVIQAGRGLIMGRLEGYRMPDMVGRMIGVIAGFTSTLVHAGGPPANIYILPQKLPRDVYVGTTVAIWLIVNVIKLIPYSILGLLRIGNVATIVVLAPFCYIGVQLGIFLNGRVSEVWFTRVVYTLLFLTALQLVTGQNFLSLFGA